MGALRGSRARDFDDKCWTGQYSSPEGLLEEAKISTNDPGTQSVSNKGTTSGAHFIHSYLAGLRAYPAAAWKATIACLLAVITGPMALVATPIFLVDPLAKEFGWTPAATLGVISLPMLFAPIVLPFAGRLVDRWGARAVAVPGTLLYALATIAVMFSGASKQQLFLLITLHMCLGYAATMTVAYKVIALWFTEHRGFGFSVLIGGTASLASAAIVPVWHFAIDSIGWRITYLILGLVILLVTFPAQYFLLREPSRPGKTGGDPAEASTSRLSEVSGWTLRSALTSRAWLLMMPILALTTGAMISIQKNSVSLFGERGYSPDTVALTVSLSFLVAFVSHIVSGIVFDRARSPRAVIPFVGSVFLGVLIITQLHGEIAPLLLAIILMGVMGGAENTILACFVARYFGLRSFAQIQGLATGVIAACIGVVPILVRSLEQSTGNYTAVLWWMLAAIGLCLLFGFLLPPFPTAETTRTVDDDQNAPTTSL